MRFHVRVHWSKEHDWSGIYEATSPGEALARAAVAIAKKAGVEDRFVERYAHFTVRSEETIPPGNGAVR